MKIFIGSITILLIALSTKTKADNLLVPSPRIIDGINVDTIKRFPHHVTIHPKQKLGEFDNKIICSGSILNNRWILTTLSCVNQGTNYRIDFKRLYLYDKYNIDSYSIILDESSVIPYPTNFDDIALIYLPVIIEFTDYVKPVQLYYKKDHSEDGKFAVMAGFGNDEYSKLTYGMFETFPCQDEYLQLCTKGWGKNTHVPCSGNEGGGLILGWPNNPHLIGIFSNPKECSSNIPAVFTRISQYYEWIMAVIGDNNRTTTPSYQS